MKPHTEHPEVLTNYIQAPLQMSGQLTAILHHMWEHDSPDSDEGPLEVLPRLVADVMPARWTKRDSDLETAAKLITATSNAIARDLFLVCDDPPFDDDPFDIHFDDAASNGSGRLP